jgi:HK97 family phage major capsid protein
METTEQRKEGFQDGESIGLQYRSLEIREDAINDEDRSVELSFSSEEPGERLRGFEILDHSKGAARMQRINTGAPLLWNHDPNDQIGVVDKATIGEDKRGHAIVRFGKSQRAQEIFNDVKDRIKTLVSFGYRIHQVTDTKADNEGVNSYRVMDWEPFEISLVSIPMDMTVGVGRASGDSMNVVRVANAETSTPLKTNKTEDKIMSDIKKVEASETETRNIAEVAPQAFIPSSEDKAKVRREEIKRQNGIRSLGEKFGFGDDAERAIEEGTALESFRASVTESWEAPSASINHDGLNESVGMNEKELRQFSVVKAIRDIKSGKGLNGLEREASEQAARNAGLSLGGNDFFIPAEYGKRDLEAGTDAEGGYTVATEVGGLIEKLDAQLVSASLGATRLTGLQGNVNLPKLDGGATASWVDEEGAVSASAQTFGQLALSPKRLAVRTIYSDQLVNQSSLSVENIVRDDLIKREALALDLAAMDGSGSSNQPTGVANTSGIGSITFGGAPTYADYVNIWDEIAKDNAVLENLAYVTSSTSIAKGLQTAKVASSDSQMIISEAPGGGFSVLGIPVVMFNQTLTVANQLLFANWSELVIASWGARKVTVDPYSNAANGQVAVTTNCFHDIGVRHAQSFAKSSDSAAQ